MEYQMDVPTPLVTFQCIFPFFSFENKTKSRNMKVTFSLPFLCEQRYGRQCSLSLSLSLSSPPLLPPICVCNINVMALGAVLHRTFRVRGCVNVCVREIQPEALNHKP